MFLQNYVRVVEVWWDEYKDYFYASRPESKALPYGDISELKKFREDHNCKSFKWFMEEIAYDITAHYPLPPRNVEWGEVSSSPVFRHPDVRIQSQCLKEGREKWGGIHGSREGLQKCLAETTLRAYPLLVPNHQSCPDHETTPPPSLCTLDCQQILPHFLRSSTHHVPLSFCLLFLPVSLTALVSEIITTKDHFSVLLHQSPLGLPSFYGFSRRLPTFQYTGHWHSPCQRYWAVVIK